MKILIDTDVFCKLHLAGLLEEAVATLGTNLAECGRLAALPYMLRRGRLLKHYGREACGAMESVALTLPAVPYLSELWLEKLIPIEEIDEGEAQIFAAAAEFGLVVISGDKRALRALKNVTDIAPALDGRIVVLEALMLALLDRLGERELRRRVGPIAAMEKVIRFCFSNENENLRMALISYFDSIVLELKPLVLWDPRRQGAT